MLSSTSSSSLSRATRAPAPPCSQSPCAFRAAPALLSHRAGRQGVVRCLVQAVRHAQKADLLALSELEALTVTTKGAVWSHIEIEVGRKEKEEAWRVQGRP